MIDPPPPSLPTMRGNNQCLFVLQKKGRRCRLPPVPGSSSQYCVEHIVKQDDSTGDRIVCPLDGSHSCSKNNLQKHLKRCNAAKHTELSFFEANVNNIRSSLLPAKTLRQSALNIVAGVISLLVSRKNGFSVTKICNDIIDLPSDEILFAKHSAVRQKTQIVSLLSILEVNQLLTTGCIFIEMGAGKGQLSSMTHKLLVEKFGVEKSSLSQFILVDSGTCRYKCETKPAFKSTAVFGRVRIDIKDLNLGLVPEVSQSNKKIVVLSKHLCGAATDLALNCVLETLPRERLLGGIIALCCHHKCQWDSFGGTDYLSRIGIDEEKFAALSCITSWCTCAMPNSNAGSIAQRNKIDKLKNNEEQRLRERPDALPDAKDSKPRKSIKCNETAVNLDTIKYLEQLSLSQSEKEEIGRTAKHILDHARIDYLQTTLGDNFKSELLQYAELTDTLENTCLVVSRIKTDS